MFWVHGEVTSPPFSEEAQKRTGDLLSDLQGGAFVPFPLSRPMPSIGPHCHELRVRDTDKTWRIIYIIHPQAIFVIDVFQKSTRETPQWIIENCRRRLRRIEQAEWRAKHG